MQFKQTVVRLILLIIPYTAFSQSTYLPQGSREHHLLERLEILAQNDSVLNFSKTRPFSRRHFMPHINGLDTMASLTDVDRYNLYVANINNIEWTDIPRDSLLSRRSIGRFYQTPAHLYEVHAKDFFLSVNPVFQYYVGKENNSDQHIFLNTRGVSIRGRIADKIGFAAYVTDNQERDPLYVQAWEEERKAVPGQGFYKDFKVNGYDYFDARGYV
ncbi:MAG: hypothetical protein H0U44_10595, partial [Flavisolibacter sp.]|nr:hypothetical protein [Flavisolibacter sp.]